MTAGHEFSIVTDDTTSPDFDFLNDSILTLRANTLSLRTPRQMGDYTHSRFGSSPNHEYYEVNDIQVRLYSKASATPTQIRQKLQDLEVMIEKIRRYHESQVDLQPYWVYMRNEDEGTYGHRSMIYRMSYQIVQEVPGTGVLLGEEHVQIHISISHSPFWEQVNSTSLAGITETQQTGLSTFGGKIYLPSLLTLADHTAPSRIERLEIAPYSTSSGPKFSAFWIGVRRRLDGLNPTYDGQATQDFAFEWSFYANSTSTSAGGANDFGTNIGTCTFAAGSDPAMLKRAYMPVSDLVTFAKDSRSIIGRWIVLVRMKVPSGTRIAVRVDHGWSADATNKTQSFVRYVDGDDGYHLVDLGEIQIPGEGYSPELWDGSVTNDLSDYFIELYMQRVSGSGSVILSGLGILPAEHMAYIESGLTLTSTTSNYSAKAVLASNSRDRLVGTFYDFTGGTLERYPAPIIYDGEFMIPVDPTHLVVFIDDILTSAGNDIANDTCGVTLTHRPRYQLMRD